MKKWYLFLAVSLLTLGLVVTPSYANRSAWESDWLSSGADRLLEYGDINSDFDRSAESDEGLSSGTESALENDWMTSGSVAESDWMIPDTSAKKELTTFSSSELIGAPVKDSQGDLVGMISIVEIDSKGHALAIINHGDYDKYGEGGRFTPVPFDALKVSEEFGKVEVALNVDESQLEAAPFFDPTKSGDQQYAGDIYRFYGIQPYWTSNMEECALREDINNQSDWDTGRMDNFDQDQFSLDSDNRESSVY